jgi:hypothetical protein
MGTFSKVDMPESTEKSAGFGTWDEWRYRHEFFWAATTRWIVAVLAIAGLPYSSEQLRNSFGWLTIIFPLLACFIGAVAFGHLLAEHARAIYVRWHASYRDKESEFLSDVTVRSRAHLWLRRPISWHIAPYIFFVLALGLLGLTGLNLVLSRAFLENGFSKALPVCWARVVDAIGYLWIAVGIGTAVALLIGDRVSGKPRASAHPTA